MSPRSRCAEPLSSEGGSRGVGAREAIAGSTLHALPSSARRDASADRGCRDATTVVPPGRRVRRTATATRWRSCSFACLVWSRRDRRRRCAAGRRSSLVACAGSVERVRRAQLRLDLPRHVADPEAALVQHEDVRQRREGQPALSAETGESWQDDQLIPVAAERSRSPAFLWRRNVVSDVVQGIIAGGVLAFITFQLLAHIDVRNVNGWTTVYGCGEPGNDILLRAACAHTFPGPINVPQEAVYWTTKVDRSDQALSGQHARATT